MPPMEKELDREGDELNWVKKKRLIVSVREKREKKRERERREREERERGERGGGLWWDGPLLT